MKIKLIMPRMSLRPMDSEFKRRMAPSLALLVLAALTPDDVEVTIVDENVDDLDVSDEPDMVGVTVNIDTSSRAYEISRHYRDRGIPVLLGGIHVSANPEEAALHADAICVGEAETVWNDIIGDARNSQLRPRYQARTAPDPALTPAPDWDLVDQSKYLYTNIVVTSRGCNYRCSFCYNSCDYVHHGVRNRPIEHVVAEIEKLGTKQVMFVDDNFIGNPSWTKQFLDSIRDMGLVWHAAVTTNIINHPDLIDAMADSGCRSLFIGFEAINPESLAAARKHQNKVDTYDHLIGELHSRGIMVNASLVLGFDQDGPEVFEETLSWLVRNKVETMTAHILTPYPGTQIFQRWQGRGRIIDNNPNHYNTSHVVFTPAKMSQEDLSSGYLWMYDQFYSLKNILKRMPNDPRRRMAFILFNLAYRKYGWISSAIAKLGFMSALGRIARRLSYGIG